LVSVIIPTCNRAPFLSDAIQSVLKQTYRDFELIVVDDGSTDNSREIVAAFGARVRYFFQENKGVSAARNAGIRAAQGAFLAFLDSDDLWHKKKLAVQIESMQSDPLVKICYTNEIWLRNGTHLNQKKKHQKFSGWIFEPMLPLCLISASSILLAREVLDRVGVFDENLPVCEDYDLWLRLALSYPITFIDQPLITKRGGHPDQLSQKYWGMDRFRVQVLERLLAHPDLKPEQHAAVISEIRNKARILILGATKNSNQEVREFYRKLLAKYENLKELKGNI
jgi:glycosyltransferase involved in cell wall biosynthesis